MINTLSLPRTGKFADLATALLYTGLSFGIATSAPVEAAGPAYYTAKLTAPVGEDRAVAGGVAWTCEGDMCVANKASARPLRTSEATASAPGHLLGGAVQVVNQRGQEALGLWGASDDASGQVRVGASDSGQRTGHLRPVEVSGGL